MNHRGFTLIEVLVALAVLAVSGMGALQLLGLLSQSNGNVSAQTEALGMARDARAQLEYLPLLRTNLGDVAWTPGAPILVGDPVIGPAGGAYSVSYTVTAFTPAVGPDRDNNGAVDVAALDIVIVVDNAGAVLGAGAVATQIGQRLLRPVSLAYRKDVQESAAIASGGLARW